VIYSGKVNPWPSREGRRVKLTPCHIGWWYSQFAIRRKHAGVLFGERWYMDVTDMVKRDWQPPTLSGIAAMAIRLPYFKR